MRRDNGRWTGGNQTVFAYLEKEGKNEVMEDGSKMVPFERYTLILKHEYIDKGGKARLLNEPLVVNGMISSFDGNAMICPVNTMIRNLLERMEYKAMQKYGE